MNMNISRRAFIKLAATSIVALALAPRIAFAAASNTLRAVRTGIQPGDKTRIVIETDKKPSYSLVYPNNQLQIILKDTGGKVAPELTGKTLISGITSSTSGNDTIITAALTKPIAEIPKKNTMILEPSGNHKYRLVLDFNAASSNSQIAKAAATTAQTTTASTKNYGKKVIVVDAGHGDKVILKIL
ncbi:hypothetical protein R83H12_02048 [Fibrobacteria bacterium R8-3-H12]